MRAEELAEKLPGYFAIVTARAVARLSSIVELASPLLMEGGVCMCLKGNLDQGEREAGDVAAEICGFEKGRVRTVSLDGGDESRCTVSYTKVSKPSIALPRRVGVAQKRPLR
jgi:16S rRNA (guanine527-N7)-methyltransferase